MDRIQDIIQKMKENEELQKRKLDLILQQRKYAKEQYKFVKSRRKNDKRRFKKI